MSLASFFASVEKDAETVFDDVFDASVAALKPIAEAAVTAAETTIVTAATSGKLSSVGSALGALATTVGQQAEAAEDHH